MASDAPDAPDPRAEGDLGCEAARRAMAALVARGGPPSGARRLRAHLVACPDCARSYRATVAHAARLGHALRKGRARRTAAETARRRLVLEGMGRSPRRAGLYLLVAAAAMLLVASRVPGLLGTRPLEARALTGEALAAGIALDPASPPVELARGDRVSTSPGARARIETRRAAFLLRESALVLVEDASPPRLRLLAGAAEVEGSAVLSTPLGVVTVEGGAAEVELEPARVAVRAARGRVRVATAGGARELEEGEELRLTPALSP